VGGDHAGSEEESYIVLELENSNTEGERMIRKPAFLFEGDNNPNDSIGLLPPVDVNLVTYAAGKVTPFAFGGCDEATLQFTGNDIAAKMLSGDFTVMAWQKLSDISADNRRTQIIIQSAAIGKRFAVQLTRTLVGAAYKFKFNIVAGTTLPIVSAIPASTNWTHVAVTRSGAWYFGYIDGVFIGAAAAGAMSIPSNTNEVISARHDPGDFGGTNQMCGFTEALTQKEIKYVVNEGSGLSFEQWALS